MLESIMNPFPRITIEPTKMNGKACIRGLRIPVHLVLDLLAAGETKETILKDYPDLEPEDIQEVLEYASWLAREETYPLPHSA